VLLATAALVGTVGLDPFVIGSLTWFPLLSISLFALIYAARNGHALRVAPLWCIALCVSVECALSANQASVCVALIALVFARFGLEKEPPQEEIAAGQACAILGLALIPALWVTYTLPAPLIDALPERAHFVPGPGAIAPVFHLVGPEYSVNTIDEPELLKLLQPASIYLLCSAVLAALVSLRHRSCNWPYLIGGLLIASLSLVWHTSLPYEFALLSPAATLPRVMPWGSVVPMTALLLALTGWLVTITALSLGDIRIGFLLALAPTFAIVVAPQGLRHPVAPDDLPGVTPEIRALLASPSGAVVRHTLRDDPTLFENLKRYRSLSTRTMRPTGDIGATYTLTLGDSTVVTPTEDAPRLRTSLGGQRGGERLTIRLAEPGLVNGLAVSPGEFIGDFPRGLRIRGGSCRPEEARDIMSIPSWQGALRFAPSGNPYWSDHADVQIIFPKAESVECLFVEQTGHSQHDWSIASVKILKGRRESSNQD